MTDTQDPRTGVVAAGGTVQASYVAETAALLWPPPSTWEQVSRRGLGRPRASAGSREFLVVPSARRPRVLLPLSARLSASAVRHGPGGQGRSARLTRRGLELLLRSGLAPLLLRDRLVVHESAAAEAHSAADVLSQLAGPGGGWAMPVTRARANRKPVIQVLDRTGTPTAFVKIGTNALTRDLVNTEAEVLTRLGARLKGIEIPRVLDHRAVGDLAMLVLAPLPHAAKTVEPAWADVVRVASTIASVDGVTRQPLDAHPYWHGLRDRLDTADPRSAELVAIWERLDPCVAVDLAWGAWHGDFAPWNMSRTRDSILLWDFERFQPDVPVGLDLVHYDLQTRVFAPGSVPGQVIGEREEAAADLLAPLGLSQPESRLVFTLYLLEVAARWIEDGQDRFGDQGAVLDAIVRGSSHAADRFVADRAADRQDTP